MHTIKQTVLLLFPALALINLQADTIISVNSPSDESFGCLVLYNGQGYRVGWAQADTYTAVNVSAKLSSNGAVNQTGRAYLTTQIGLGTSIGQQIAFTAFAFPQTVAKVILFEGLQLPPGSYYLSIIGDSPGWGSCWINAATNVITETGVLSLGGFGALTAPNAYFPATPAYPEAIIPPDLTVQGINVSRPILQITRSNPMVSISWSTNAVGFGLESAGSLFSTNWQVIKQGIVTNSGRFVFTTNAIGEQFFKLKKAAN